MQLVTLWLQYGNSCTRYAQMLWKSLHIDVCCEIHPEMNMDSGDKNGIALFFCVIETFVLFCFYLRPWATKIVIICTSMFFVGNG